MEGSETSCGLPSAGGVVGGGSGVSNFEGSPCSGSHAGDGEVKMEVDVEEVGKVGEVGERSSLPLTVPWLSVLSERAFSACRDGHGRE